MKNINYFLLATCLVLSCLGCGNTKAANNNTTKSPQPISKDSKILIAYFSQTNHTKDFAEIIHEKIGGDIFRIETTNSYPTDENALIPQGQKEVRSNFKPELKKNIDITKYDVIFLGTPVWEYTFTPPINTFLNSHDFSNKTIIPFTTHKGSGLAGIDKKIKTMFPKATLLKGLAIPNDTAKQNEEKIKDWLKELGL